MLHKGIDFHILRIFCSNCGWQRVIAHTGCAEGKRAIVKISTSKDSAHVLHAKVKEIPINQDKNIWSVKFEGYEDLLSKAHEVGLYKALEPYSNLLNGKSCPKCGKINDLNLSQEWKVKHPRY